MRQADVVVPVYRDVEVTRACLEAVLAHSGPALGALIVVDDLGPEPAMRPMLRALRDAHPQVRLVENEENLGFVRSCNRGLALRTHDAVLLNSDTLVTPGWLAELVAVREGWERIGAVCPLSNNAGLCSVPEYGAATAPPLVDAAALELQGLPRWTEVPTGVGFCLLLRGDLLDLVGLLDPAYGRGYNEENDWCQRIQALGFVVARANRAFVYHLGEVSFGGARAELDVLNARLLLRRYPHYLEQNRAFEAGPSARLAAAAARRGTLRVTVEVREGDEAALALVEALAGLEGLQLRARVGSEALRAHLEARGVPAAEASDPADLVHHPGRLDQPEALRRALGEQGHLVVSLGEVASHRVPGPEAERARALAWTCLQAAQGVIASSAFVRDALCATFGLPPERVAVVPPGQAAAPAGDAEAVRARLGLRRPYLVVPDRANLALVLEALRLVRARLGPAAPELAVLGPPEGLPADARALGPLDPGARAAVLAGAWGLATGATQEGSGQVALEAMALGVPVVALPLGALPEVATGAALLAPALSPQAFAACLEQALEPELRAGLIARGRARAAEYGWRRAALATREVYRQVVRAPHPGSLEARRALARLLGG